MLPIVITVGLASPGARSDAIDNLAREVCFAVHGADVQSIRKYEQEKIFAALRELKTRVDDRGRIAEQSKEHYELALGKAEEIDTEIAKLEYFQQYNNVLRLAARPINQNTLQIAKLKADYSNAENAADRQDLQLQIDALEAENVQLNKEIEELLPKEFFDELISRLEKMGKFETPYSFGRDIGWGVIPEITSKMESMMLDELSKAKAALLAEQKNTTSLKQSFIAALIELREAKRVLHLMERLIRETEACRTDARRIAPRRDFVANFKINCRSPELDGPLCGHGTLWINFDERGLATGQAGFARVCATGAEARECLEVPTAQVTGATGQIAANSLTATVTYMLPSDRPRNDTGDFRFEGQVTPDGDVMPIAWHGSGSLTTTENKHPLPPNKPYTVNCSGQWTTESVLACWDER